MMYKGQGSVLLERNHPLHRWDGSGAGFLLVPTFTEWEILYANPMIYPRQAGYVNTDGEVRLYSEYKNSWSTHHIDPASLPLLPDMSAAHLLPRDVERVVNLLRTLESPSCDASAPEEVSP